jgi:hypothetical protein
MTDGFGSIGPASSVERSREEEMKIEICSLFSRLRVASSRRTTRRNDDDGDAVVGVVRRRSLSGRLAAFGTFD